MCLSWSGWPLPDCSSRGLHILQSLSDYLAGEGASRKLEWELLSGDALKDFEVLKQACMTALILAFADYTKPSLLETNASKDRLGAVLLQKQARQVVPPHHLWQQSPYAS